MLAMILFTYDYSVGGDVERSRAEDRGGRGTTPSAGFLVRCVCNRKKNIPLKLA